MICALLLKSATDTRGRETVLIVVNGSNVSTFHLDLGQLWHCPVLWCTMWKGTPQDCMDHVRGAHDVPSDVKSACLDRFRFGPMPLNHVIWEFRLMFSSSGRQTSLWFTTTGCSGGGCPITPSERTTLPGCGCLFRRHQPWLSVPCLLRFQPARALRGMFAPCDAKTGYPRKTRRVHGRKRQTRVQDIPVCAPSPVTVVQAVKELAGAVVYDCRPSVLPVSIKLKDFRRPSVVRPAASSSLAAPLAEQAPVSRSSVLERAAAPVFAAVASDDSGTDLEDELLHVSPLPMMISPLPDSDTAFPVSPSRYPEPPVPALADPAPASQLSSVPLRVVNTLPSRDLFPAYTMSPAHSVYALATSPVTTDVPDASEYLLSGSPAAMDQFLVGGW